MKALRLTPLPSLRELLDLYRIRAVKKLSQNFLLDMNLTRKIIKTAGKLNDVEVCEVGPGPGGLTRAIMMGYPSKVIVIEKDNRFEPILEALAECSICKFDVIYADILDYDMSKLFSQSYKYDWNDVPPRIRLIGNLPFNVSTPLIIRWLKDISLRRNAWEFGRVPMILTFQEEVVARMVAPILSKSRCRLSVMCQNWCKVRHNFTIPGKAFVPAPDVNVGVVSFEPLIRPIIPLEFELIEKVVRTIFNQRQNMSFNSAMSLFPKKLTNDLTQELFKIADLDSKMKPFQIANEEWKRLCYAYKEICDRDPRLYNYDFRGPKATREEMWASDNSKKPSDEFEDNTVNMHVV